jgi:hypothetical protein
MSINKQIGMTEAVLTWLLEESNPSVRYLTLINLLGRNKEDAEVRRAREGIMLSGVVPAILDKQVEGSWNSPGRFYMDKYKGAVWQLIILAEHAADPADARVRQACEYILHTSQDPESYGFAPLQRSSGGGRHSEVIPCLTGNMVWSLIKLGFVHDERVRKGIDWITQYQRFDDGIDARPTGWPYDRYEMCWGRHSCHMGVVKSLKALAALPQEMRDDRAQATIDKGVEYLLAHHIFKKSHDLTKTAKPSWRKLQFPLMYQSDVLEIVLILQELGVRDERMQEAIDLIAAKQNAEGTWNLEATFNGRFQVSIEKKDRPSKWITCRALMALQACQAE